MTTFFYPVEITGNPALPAERRFFFIEVEAANSFDAFCEGNKAFKSLFPDPANRVACTRWWPHEGECPSVADMLALKRSIADMRSGVQRGLADRRRRVREQVAA